MATIDLNRLNDSQHAVATRLDEPLFVAAGAGSGKTFTLTARLVHALSRGSAADGGRYLDSIDQALVITFTKAAASEIAERVRQALRDAGAEDPHLYEESLKVDGAWISTIHSMCARILRRHGIELGIDPKFKVCEDSVADALKARAMDEVLTAVQHDDDFAELRKEYPLWGSGTSVASIVEQLRSEAAKCAHGFDDITWPKYSEISSYMARLADAYATLNSSKLTEKQRADVEPSYAALKAYCELAPGAQTPAAACKVLDSVKVPNIRKADLKPLMADLRQTHAETIVCAHYERVQLLAAQLVQIAYTVDVRYGELKLERSYLDNDDLISLALESLEHHPDVARDYADKFRLVMIDEFQDTDAKQLRLIGLLSGEHARHLTTVGDAQQSIYRFRGGDVRVFRARGRSLPPEAHVEMDVNYRSDPHVLAVVERVCGDAELLQDFLKLAASAGRTSKLARGVVDAEMPRVDLEIAEGGTSEVESATLAAQLADRLAQYHAQGQPQGSMALLLGRTTYVNLYLEALRARGLDAVVTGGSSFSSAPEVGVIQALLHTLANPHDTQDGLFRLLSSAMFMLDADDFCQLGTRAQEKLDAPTKRAIEQCFVEGKLELYDDAQPSARLVMAHKVLSRAFSRLGRWRLADVCQAVVDESGWLHRLEQEGQDGLAKAANVLAAVRYVRELTVDLGLGVSQAAREYDQWLKAAKLTPKNLAGEFVDAVQVMTIHGSKGLQFGVCAVAECWGNAKANSGLSVGRHGDTCMVCANPKNTPSGFSTKKKQLEVPDAWERCHTAAEWAIFLTRSQITEEMDEKARLLYVALTRAEESLVVGIPVAEAERYRSLLGMGMLGAFPELDELVPGECVVGIEPERPIEVEARERDESGAFHTIRRPAAIRPGIARVVSLTREERDQPWIANSAGTLKGFDGELPASVTRIPLLGTPAFAEGQQQSASAFAIYDELREELPVFGWNPREGVFSYSSAHALMRQRTHADKGLEDEPATHASRERKPPTPPRAQQDAEAEGAPYTPDTDKATNLGSAFHELAQTMVETRSDHDPQRLKALARTWRLSGRQTTRLNEAIARWEGSELRREAWCHGLVRAEVPFFVRVDSVYGNYVEGAIDLLATDPGSSRALVVDYKTGDIGLNEDEIEQRHCMQANFYAWVLRDQGFKEVECAFCCVEVDDGSGGPVVVRYCFDDEHVPNIG